MGEADADAQNHVGLKRVDSLLKELSKKHDPDQYTGANDQILAKSIHKEKAAKTLSDMPAGEVSPVGSKQNKLPSMVKGR